MAQPGLVKFGQQGMGWAFPSGSRTVVFKDGRQANLCCLSKRLMEGTLEDEGGRNG